MAKHDESLVIHMTHRIQMAIHNISEKDSIIDWIIEITTESFLLKIMKR